MPQVRYARSGSVNIAYQVVGHGPIDVIFVMGWVSHVEEFWTEPSFARFLARLAGDGADDPGVAAGAGLHTGECLSRGSTVEGVAVDVARAIAERAAAGELLISRTVKDLVAGAGLRVRRAGPASGSARSRRVAPLRS